MSRAKENPKSVGLRATGGKRTLRFGLVSVVIGMAPATDATARIAGKYLDPESLTPVKQQYINGNGEVVKPVRGYAWGDHYVTLEDHEMPVVDGTDVIDLLANVRVSEVPAEWITGTALAWPVDVAQDQAYALFAAYLRDNGRAFIGRTVISGTTKVLVIRWSGVYGCLIAQTLAYHAQVRWANVEVVREGVAGIADPPAELATMADTLFEGMEDSFDWAAVTDEYGEALEAAVAEKADKGSVSVQPVAAGAPVATDLMAALQATINAAPKTKARKAVSA